mgnify:CR=1 FL=1
MYTRNTWLKVTGQSNIEDGLYQVVEVENDRFFLSQLSVFSGEYDTTEVLFKDFNPDESHASVLLPGQETFAFSTQVGDVYYFDKPYCFVGFRPTGYKSGAKLHGLAVVLSVGEMCIELQPLQVLLMPSPYHKRIVFIEPQDTVLDGFNVPKNFVDIAPYRVTNVDISLLRGSHDG